MLNQRPPFPCTSLPHHRPRLKPRRSPAPCEAASILWVSEDFNTPPPPPESRCRKQNDYPAIVAGAAGARQQICEPLSAFESWVFRIDSHSSSSFVVLWCFFLLQVPWLWHSKKSEGSANRRPLHNGWLGYTHTHTLKDVWGNFAHTSTRNTAADTFPDVVLEVVSFVWGQCRSQQINYCFFQILTLTVNLKYYYIITFLTLLLWSLLLLMQWPDSGVKTALSSSDHRLGQPFHFLIATVCSTTPLTESFSSLHHEQREAFNQLKDPTPHPFLPSCLLCMTPLAILAAPVWHRRSLTEWKTELRSPKNSNRTNNQTLTIGMRLSAGEWSECLQHNEPVIMRSCCCCRRGRLMWHPLCSTIVICPCVCLKRDRKKKSASFVKNSRIHRIHILCENATFCDIVPPHKIMHQPQSAGCRGVYTVRVATYLGCRSCRWSRGGTCTYWAPRTRRACSRADTELLWKDSKEGEGDQHSYQIKVTKHLIPLILDLAVNNLVYHTLQ